VSPAKAAISDSAKKVVTGETRERGEIGLESYERGIVKWITRRKRLWMGTSLSLNQHRTEKKGKKRNQGFQRWNRGGKNM